MTFKRIVAIGFTLAALLMLKFGLEYFAIAVAGQEKRAVIDYSVRSSGARNPSYRVHYVFSTSDNQEWKGSVTMPAGDTAQSALRIRYLPQKPSINAAGTDAVLVFYGILWSLPGALLAYFSLRALWGRDRKKTLGAS